ncbi:MAG: aminotransferase class V-fold PLP-dependent enzyme [Halieaceae bacterium]
MNDEIRQHFPILAHKAYFNACSYGPLSLEVKAAIEQYLHIRMEDGARWDIYCDKTEQVRELVATILQAPADDISVSTSASESLNTLMTAFDFSGSRNKIVVTDFDFPSTAQIMLAQESRGAKIVRANADSSDTDIPLAEFDRLIDDQTLLVSVPLVCYRNGVWVDTAPIVEMAHARGAQVLVDAYQGIGAQPFDVGASGIDILVAGCTKYLIGASGVAFMYVRDSVHSTLQPTATGWFAQQDPSAMDIHAHQPHQTARRFEAGTHNSAGLFAAEAGMKLLLDTGLETIAERIRAVTDQVKEAVAVNDWTLVTPPDRHGAMLAIKSTDAAALVAKLEERNILLSQRDGNIRIAPHYYNDSHDVEKLISALQANAKLLA